MDLSKLKPPPGSKRFMRDEDDRLCVLLPQNSRECDLAHLDDEEREDAACIAICHWTDRYCQLPSGVEREEAAAQMHLWREFRDSVK